jgi:hypothetical protein
MSEYHLLAEATVVLHAAYVLFVVLLAPLILVGAWLKWSWVRNFWLRLTHLIMMVFVGLEAVVGMQCPLTDLEDHFRGKAGQAQYEVDFLAHWADRLLYVQLNQFELDFIHISFSLFLIGLFVFVRPRWPWRARPSPVIQSSAA